MLILRPSLYVLRVFFFFSINCDWFAADGILCSGRKWLQPGSGGAASMQNNPPCSQMRRSVYFQPVRALLFKQEISLSSQCHFQPRREQLRVEGSKTKHTVLFVTLCFDCLNTFFSFSTCFKLKTAHQEAADRVFVWECLSCHLCRLLNYPTIRILVFLSKKKCIKSETWGANAAHILCNSVGKRQLKQQLVRQRPCVCQKKKYCSNHI